MRLDGLLPSRQNNVEQSTEKEITYMCTMYFEKKKRGCGDVTIELRVKNLPSSLYSIFHVI